MFYLMSFSLSHRQAKKVQKKKEWSGKWLEDNYETEFCQDGKFANEISSYNPSLHS